MTPLLLRNKTDRAAVQFAHASAMRSTGAIIEQLQEQLRAERAQHAFNCSEYESKSRRFCMIWSR
jgi:hypothetical protein